MKNIPISFDEDILENIVFITFNHILKAVWYKQIGHIRSFGKLSDILHSLLLAYQPVFEKS